MVTTTASKSDVKRVLSGTDLSDSDIQSFLDAAAGMYDDVTGGISNTTLLTEIEANLAAHLIATGPERQLASASEGDGSVEFEGETGEGLNATTYGQTAMALDPTDQLGTANHFTLSP